MDDDLLNSTAEERNIILGYDRRRGRLEIEAPWTDDVIANDLGECPGILDREVLSIVQITTGGAQCPPTVSL